MVDISILVILFSKILVIIVSLSSVPIERLSSSMIIYLCKYFPYNDSLETRISFKPSSNNFLASKKVTLAPNLTTVFLVLKSTISSENFLIYNFLD